MPNTKAKKKKILPIIGPIILLAAIIGVVFYVKFPKKDESIYEYIEVKRTDLIREVSVTGRVKPVESVDLAFETVGKISNVSVRVGDQIKKDSVLIKLDDKEIQTKLSQAIAQLERAQAGLAQYSAARETEEVKLDELKKGTREEEIKIAKTNVSNKENALRDAETNLANIAQKADVDIANVYADVIDIINDSYAKADDAVHNKTDALFTNTDFSNPQLSFSTSNSKAKNTAEQNRSLAGSTLASFENDNKSIQENDFDSLDAILKNTSLYLSVIQSYLNAVSGAVTNELNLADATKTAYTANISTATTNINTARSNVNNQQQAISAQKNTNQNAISTATSSVNDAVNSLESAKDELALKEAGATNEQIKAQESKIKQAQANIASQEAEIKQTRANKENYEAQISKMAIKSPIDGLITKQDAKVGEIVSANVIIVSLISNAGFTIEAYVPEVDIAYVKKSDSAIVALDAYDDEKFNASVVKIDPAETILDGMPTYKVSLAFSDGKDERIKSGMTADIDIITNKLENVIAIPGRAITTEDGLKTVQIYKDSATIEQRSVTAGLHGSNGYVEIIDGLAEGEKVVVFARKQ